MKHNCRPALQIRDLQFGYPGEPPFLQIPRWDLFAGGIHVLLGPNGCGKTTLLKLVAGLLRPAGGTIIDNISGSGRPILVHQAPYLFSGTLFQNVAYGLKIRKVPRQDVHRRVNRELEKWDLLPLAHRRARRISGGESQRTAMARAMVLKPRLLLLDEPTASIDPQRVAGMEAQLRRIAADGTTLIISTHHMDFAYRIADSLTRLAEGRPVPTNENLIPGRVTERDDYFSYFKAGSVQLLAPARDGDFHRAVFSEGDVLLSQKPIESSARNLLKCRITAVEKSGSQRRLTLDAGFSFRARISAASMEEMGLETGAELYAAVKSSSIHLY